MAEGLNIIHHLVDSAPWAKVEVAGYSLPITKHVVMLWISAGLVFALFTWIGRQRSLVPTGARNFFEMILLYLRDEVVYANLGAKYGERYLPYLWTLFFFILFSNLLGMVPFGATATGNLAVTAALALVTFGITHVSGMAHYGPLGYLKRAFLVGPPYMWPLMVFLEAIGHLVKPFALTVRLFANMLSGHILLLVFFGFLLAASGIVGAVVTGVTVFGILVFSLMELMVAVLQAFVFVLLSTVFINMALHADH